MPSSASELTEAHRLAQLDIGVEAVEQLLDAWLLLDLDDIDGTMDRWLRLSTSVVQAQRARSIGLASDYLRLVRGATIIETGPYLPVPAGPANAEALATSLRVTGPYRVRSALAGGVDLAEAGPTGQTSSARAGMRHALNGGRETIVGSVAADPRAVGWRRVTSGKACTFCRMLAGRGAVYRERTATFDAHDGCSCSAAPVYR